MSTAIDTKLNATLANVTDIFKKDKPKTTTEVLFVFDNKPDILNFTSIGEQLEAEFETVLSNVNTVLSADGGNVVSGLSTSLGQQATAAVGDITAASGPSVDFLLDQLSHKLP